MTIIALLREQISSIELYAHKVTLGHVHIDIKK